jgi:hypothetical protein
MRMNNRKNRKLSTNADKTVSADISFNHQENEKTSTDVIEDNSAQSGCKNSDCQCFLKRGQMFLPPNLLQSNEMIHDSKR